MRPRRNRSTPRKGRWPLLRQGSITKHGESITTALEVRYAVPRSFRLPRPSQAGRLMDRAIHDVIDWVVPWVELVGCAFILGGVVLAVVRICAVPFMVERPPLIALQIRTGLGLSLALGLEFQLAGDILRTAVSPTFHEVALLAAIAAIRTGLNFFLGMEFVAGRHQVEALTHTGLNHRIAGPPAMGHRATAGASGTDPSPAPVTSAEDPRWPRQAVGTALRSAVLGPLVGPWHPPQGDDTAPSSDGSEARAGPRPPGWSTHTSSGGARGNDH